jgi:hypothetical protein
MQKARDWYPGLFAALLVVVIGDELLRECNESPKWMIGDSATVPWSCGVSVCVP